MPSRYECVVVVSVVVVFSNFHVAEHDSLGKAAGT